MQALVSKLKSCLLPAVPLDLTVGFARGVVGYPLNCIRPLKGPWSSFRGFLQSWTRPADFRGSNAVAEDVQGLIIYRYRCDIGVYKYKRIIREC